MFIVTKLISENGTWTVPNSPDHPEVAKLYFTSTELALGDARHAVAVITEYPAEPRPELEAAFAKLGLPLSNKFKSLRRDLVPIELYPGDVFDYWSDSGRTMLNYSEVDTYSRSGAIKDWRPICLYLYVLVMPKTRLTLEVSMERASWAYAIKEQEAAHAITFVTYLYSYTPGNEFLRFVNENLIRWRLAKGLNTRNSSGSFAVSEVYHMKNERTTDYAFFTVPFQNGFTWVVDDHRSNIKALAINPAAAPAQNFEIRIPEDVMASGENGNGGLNCFLRYKPSAWGFPYDEVIRDAIVYHQNHGYWIMNHVLINDTKRELLVVACKGGSVTGEMVCDQLLAQCRNIEAGAEIDGHMYEGYTVIPAVAATEFADEVPSLTQILPNLRLYKLIPYTPAPSIRAYQ